LKIVTWNCNGGFRKKFEKIFELDADIYVIQECEDPIRANHPNFQSWAKNHLWIGESKNKGLGIFVKEGIKLELLDWSDKYLDHTVKYFLPCRINRSFNLLGVWTHRNNSPNFGYIGQFWKYFKINGESMKDSFIVGDFNSNVIWDEWDRWWNHSDVVRELGHIGLESLYHKFHGEHQGKESIPTLYFRKSKAQFYHIDYIFGPNNLLPSLSKFEIGKHEDWLYFSNHMPIVCEFSFPITLNQ